jgi:DNA-binding MarR family transcriptional regulator
VGPDDEDWDDGDDRGTVLSFLVRHVWLSMRAAIASELTHVGLGVQQFATLLMVDEVPGLSVSDVARKCGSTRQAANEMVAGLEADGLIARSPHPTDRRTHALSITGLGRERLAKALPAVRRCEDELQAGLTAEQKQAALGWMLSIVDTCDARDIRPEK